MNFFLQLVHVLAQSTFVLAFLSGKHWGPSAASLAYPNMKFIIDKFHSLGHVDSWCAETCMPNLPENAPLVADLNTSICEITFSWLARYKHSTRKMRQRSFSFFVSEITFDHSENIISQIGGKSAVADSAPRTPTNTAGAGSGSTTSTSSSDTESLSSPSASSDGSAS